MKQSSKLKNSLLILGGTLSVVLGALGIILPLLPTTPFLLLGAYCYVKSSKKRYDWLIHHKIFGIYIYSYITYKAIDLKTKVGAIILLWTTMVFSMIIVERTYVTIILIVIGAAVTIHLLMLKTLKKEQMLYRKQTEMKTQTAI